MPGIDDIKWFKEQFYSSIESSTKGTLFTPDFYVALACQETGEIWPILRKKGVETKRILELCVGDTLDDTGKHKRRAFPKNRRELENWPQGKEMFALARQSLLDMSKYIDSYKSSAAHENKFCHAFGIFQYDIQFFKTNPKYFLDKTYTSFEGSFQQAQSEIEAAFKGLSAKLKWKNKTELSDREMAWVAICYNAGVGSFNPQKDLAQGHHDGNKYYGQLFFDFLRTSKRVPNPQPGADGSPTRSLAAEPVPGAAFLPPARAIGTASRMYRVHVAETALRLRSAPVIEPYDPAKNIVAELPGEQLVHALSDQPVNGFIEAETSLQGAYYRGYGSLQYLKPVQAEGAGPSVRSFAIPAESAIPEAEMPRAEGRITKRTDVADGHSLNEPGQPGRQGTTPDELRTELGAIIGWLGVDNRTYKRYLPRESLTFCNIYAHDYCHLAGVYLPRVWWTSAAIESWARGVAVTPIIDVAIDEQRANDLFRWLRDYGPRFGWRRAAALTELQTEVNQGAIGIIVARRTNDGKSGHIVAVVPETDTHIAKREHNGEVIAPLQSQAGESNFRYGTGRLNWWKGNRFADSAFWLHA